jgi:hypothetical protein
VSDLGFDLRREGFEIFQRRTDPSDRVQLLTVHYTIIRISVYLEGRSQAEPQQALSLAKTPQQ